MTNPYKILEEIDTDLKERLLEGHRLLEIPAGHQLIFQSDWGADVYVVSKGVAKARCLTMEGDEVVLALIGLGALIGDLALLSPKPVRTVDVVAITAMSLLKLRHGVFEDILKSSPALTQALSYLQVRRLTSLGNRLMVMHEDATTRVLATLLDLARLSSPDGDPCQPIPAISQQEIATIAGLSRGSTSTLITKLRGNGTLEQTPEGLRFANLTALQRRGLLPESTPTQAKT